MRSILQIGNDSGLLVTRADVLRLTGATVETASGSEAIKRVGCERFDLIVFCHTVPEPQIDEISSAAREFFSNVSILKVLSSSFNDTALDETVPDPTRLVAKVAEALDNARLEQQTSR